AEVVAGAARGSGQKEHPQVRGRLQGQGHRGRRRDAEAVVALGVAFRLAVAIVEIDVRRSAQGGSRDIAVAGQRRRRLAGAAVFAGGDLGAVGVGAVAEPVAVVVDAVGAVLGVGLIGAVGIVAVGEAVAVV